MYLSGHDKNLSIFLIPKASITALSLLSFSAVTSIHFRLPSWEIAIHLDRGFAHVFR